MEWAISGLPVRAETISRLLLHWHVRVAWPREKPSVSPFCARKIDISTLATNTLTDKQPNFVLLRAAFSSNVCDKAEHD